MKELLNNILREESVEYITEHYPNLRLLANASEEELKQIPFVGEAKARELKTIIDISKSLLVPEKNSRCIKSPADVYDLMKIMSLYEEERFCVILLDIKNKVIDQLCVSKGSLTASIVHPREAFAPAIRMKAAAIIFVHNHPSNDPEPSSEDIQTTERLVKAGEILGIKVLDHIIIANSGYQSLKEKGVI